MANKPLQSVVFAKELTQSFVDLYTVESGVVSFGIDAVVFNNYLSVKVDVTVRLIRTGSGTQNNEVTTNKTIRGEENFLAPGLIGQALQTGDKIQAKASNANSVTAFITGTKVTG